MSWQDYVTQATNLGFTRVCIIARANYATVGTTGAADIATAWQDGDNQVNENQELLDNWTDKNKRTFCFFGLKFNIILRDPDDDENCSIVCAQGNQICVARQFKTIWFIAFGVKKKMSMKKGAKKEKQTGFSGAQGAYAAIMKDIWDALEENDI